MITIKHKKYNIWYSLSFFCNFTPMICESSNDSDCFRQSVINKALFQKHSMGEESSAISKLQSILDYGFDIVLVDTFEQIEDYEEIKIQEEKQRLIMQPLADWAKDYFCALATDFAKQPKSGSDICEIIHQSNLEGNVYGTKSIELMEELESVIIDVLERMHDTLI